jgi:hypothetical protein
MLVVVVNMLICGLMIINKVNVFDFGMEVVKEMVIDLKRNNNVKKHVLVQKELVNEKKKEINYLIPIKFYYIK